MILQKIQLNTKAIYFWSPIPIKINNDTGEMLFNFTMVVALACSWMFLQSILREEEEEKKIWTERELA